MEVTEADSEAELILKQVQRKLEDQIMEPMSPVEVTLNDALLTITSVMLHAVARTK